MKNLVYMLILTTGTFFGQPMIVSNVISDNKITPFKEQKLILIDFWATWCAPCIYATQQLEILQEINKDKIFIISISDEHVTKINTYLEKRPIDLMVTSDYENYTFSKYDVVSRPYSVLLDIKGNVLWKGNPSDLSQQKIDQFYQHQSKDASLKKLEKFLEIKNEINVSKKKLIENQNLMISELFNDENEFIITEDEVSFSGNLTQLFYTLKKLNPYEIKFAENSNKKVQIITTKSLWDYEKDKILEEVLNYFKLKSELNESELSGIELEVINDTLLWDSNQFDWEGSPVNYIIGTDRIQADNMTIKELCNLLCITKNDNYIYIGSNENKLDWDFQYFYDELMKEELESSFGIKLNKTKIITTIVTISSRE